VLEHENVDAAPSGQLFMELGSLAELTRTF